MSQKLFEIMMELKPLETLFTVLSDEKKMMYAEDLEEFSVDTIRRAVARVRKKWDRVSFPPPAVIVTECNVLTGANQSAGGKQNGLFSWEERDKIRAQITQEYVYKYMRERGSESERQGYDYYLRRYVQAVAFVQAQLIHPSPAGHFAIDWYIIFFDEMGDRDETNFKREFILSCQEQARTGIIDVIIPQVKIYYWKMMAGLEANRRQKTSDNISFDVNKVAIPVPFIDGKLEQVYG